MSINFLKKKKIKNKNKKTEIKRNKKDNFYIETQLVTVHYGPDQKKPPKNHKVTDLEILHLLWLWHRCTWLPDNLF